MLRERDYRDKECYYCGKKGHIQACQKHPRENMIAFKKAYDEKNDGTIVVIDDDLILTTCVYETQSLKVYKG